MGFVFSVPRPVTEFPHVGGFSACALSQAVSLGLCLMGVTEGQHIRSCLALVISNTVSSGLEVISPATQLCPLGTQCPPVPRSHVMCQGVC